MPDFKHNCDKCKLLGTYAGHDVYKCPWGHGGDSEALVARHGDDPKETWSMPAGYPARWCEQNAEARASSAELIPPYLFAVMMALVAREGRS